MEDKPLMFINTVASENITSTSQQTFDSRNNKFKRLNITETLKRIEILLLDKRNIICSIETCDSLTARVVAIDEDKITILNPEQESIPISDIKSIKIISF